MDYSLTFNDETPNTSPRRERIIAREFPAQGWQQEVLSVMVATNATRAGTGSIELRRVLREATIGNTIECGFELQHTIPY